MTTIQISGVPKNTFGGPTFDIISSGGPTPCGPGPDPELSILAVLVCVKPEIVKVFEELFTVAKSAD